jgi:hypothetical protein
MNPHRSSTLMIRKQALRILAVCPGLLGTFLSAPPVRAAGIPEPSQLWYGAVWNRINGQTVRLTTGLLTWECRPVDGGPPVLLTTSLTNINDQFSFALEVPCETLPPGFTLSANTLEITVPPRVYARTNLTLDGEPVFLGPNASPLFSAERGQLEQVNLFLFRLDTDTDQDGLPDWWEDQYFGGQGDPGDDPDNDGVNNLKEYQAGTNPLDDQSLFAFIAITPHPAGGMQIEWASALDRSYTVERSGALLEGFLPIATGLAATPPANVYHDETATSAGPFFYRIKLEPRPSGN